MRSRTVALAVALCLAFAGGAIGCFARAAALRSDADWHLARGSAEAKEYSLTLDGAAAERQLATFELRAEILKRAHFWQRLELLFVLASVGSAVGTYLGYLFFQLRQQLEDAGPPEEPSGR